MVDQLHDEHFHLMVSIWPFFYPGSTCLCGHGQHGFFIDRTKSPRPSIPQGMALYDATNPGRPQLLLEPGQQHLF